MLWSLVLVVLACCTPPSVSEDFRSVSQKDSLGRYAFQLDMSDSLSTYNISFFTRIDCLASRFDDMTDIPVQVSLKSPSGVVFTEGVFLPRAGFDAERSGTYDARMDYRTGCVPVECGVWNIYLGLPSVMGLRGVGVILSSEKAVGLQSTSAR